MVSASASSSQSAVQPELRGTAKYLDYARKRGWLPKTAVDQTLYDMRLTLRMADLFQNLQNLIISYSVDDIRSTRIITLLAERFDTHPEEADNADIGKYIESSSELTTLLSEATLLDLTDMYHAREAWIPELVTPIFLAAKKVKTVIIDAEIASYFQGPEAQHKGVRDWLTSALPDVCGERPHEIAISGSIPPEDSRLYDIQKAKSRLNGSIAHAAHALGNVSILEASCFNQLHVKKGTAALQGLLTQLKLLRQHLSEQSAAELKVTLHSLLVIDTSIFTHWNWEQHSLSRGPLNQLAYPNPLALEQLVSQCMTGANSEPLFKELLSVSRMPSPTDPARDLTLCCCIFSLENFVAKLREEKLPLTSTASPVFAHFPDVVKNHLKGVHLLRLFSMHEDPMTERMFTVGLNGNISLHCYVLEIFHRLMSKLLFTYEKNPAQELHADIVQKAKALDRVIGEYERAAGEIIEKYETYRTCN